jgi:hypothetical protein
MNDNLLGTSQPLYKEKPCPICGKLFSDDPHTGFVVSRVFLSQYLKHIVDVHLARVHSVIHNYPRELRRLETAADGAVWVAMLYYHANYLGPKYVEKWVAQQLESLKQDLAILERMQDYSNRSL